MRENVKEFARLASEVFDAPEPVLEIGSRPAEGQHGFADLRRFFPGKRYVGGDLMAGPGVDLILDGHLLGLRDDSLGTVVTLDTIEHVQDPLVMLQEVHRVLRPEGLVIIAAPMMFPIHNHPWDYWRFTPAALDLLFRPFDSVAVMFQGDPVAPQAVLGLAQKTASAYSQVAFEAAVEALRSQWSNAVPGGPLVRFEPLFEAIAWDHDAVAGVAQSVPELVAGDVVEQRFTCPGDQLARIDLKFTRARPTSARVDVRLIDETDDRTVAEGEMFGVHVLNDVWTPLQFPVVGRSAGHAYRLTLTSPDGESGHTLAPLLATADGDQGLSHNGRAVSGRLCIRALCRAGDYAPMNYRGVGAPITPPVASPRPVEGGTVQQVGRAFSGQLWYVSSRTDERFERLSRRLDRVDEQLESILLFIRNLQASGPFELLRRVGRASRRSDR